MSLNSNPIMTPKFAYGGIGDLLLSLEDAIAQQTINVYSHFKNAPQIFTKFGITIQRFEYYKTVEELHDLYIPGQPLDRKRYPVFPVPPSKLQFKKTGQVIGIHPEGSQLSNDYWSARGCPTKNMTEEFFINLVNAIVKKIPKATLLVFSSNERSEEFNDYINKTNSRYNVIVSYKDIWDSLSAVPLCDCVVAMDSCIKTMSAIRRIHTITLVGNYLDPFRDETFINPYVSDGVMDVVKFVDINRVPIADIVDKIKVI